MDKLSNFKDRLVEQFKNTTHLEKLYLASILFILLVGFANIQAYEQFRFIPPTLTVIIGLSLLYYQKPAGWNILFMHAIAFGMPIIFLILSGGRYRLAEGILGFPLLILCLVLMLLLLLKPIRKQFDIHSREIVVGFIGGIFIAYIPPSFQAMFARFIPMLIPLLVYIFLLVAFLQFLRKLPPLTSSNWNTYLEGLSGFTSDQYYIKVQEKLESNNVEGISYTRVMLSKRGILSSKREYLRISFESVTHDISLYPFALGSYASSWSYQTLTGGELLIASLPYIGLWLHRKFYPETYYIADSRAMFQLLVHQTQLEIIDELTNQKGLRKLSEQQRQLHTRSVFER